MAPHNTKCGQCLHIRTDCSIHTSSRTKKPYNRHSRCHMSPLPPTCIQHLLIKWPHCTYLSTPQTVNVCILLLQHTSECSPHMFKCTCQWMSHVTTCTHQHHLLMKWPHCTYVPGYTFGYKCVQSCNTVCITQMYVCSSTHHTSNLYGTVQSTPCNIIHTTLEWHVYKGLLQERYT